MLAPGLVPTIVDIARRPRAIAALSPIHVLGYVATVLLSAFLWGLLLWGASVRRGSVRHGSAALFIAGWSWIFGVQHAFRSRWAIYLSRDAMDSVWDLWSALRGSVPAWQLTLHVGAWALVAAALVLAARRVVRGRRGRAPFAVLPAALAIALLPRYILVSYRQFQSTSVDLIYVNGLHERQKQKSNTQGFLQPRHFERPKPMQPGPGPTRNVVLLLQESTRFDDSCVAYEPDCQKATRFTNRALPERLPFLNARANGSCTGVSLGVLFSGLPPSASKEESLSAPFAWDLAAAAGYDTAWWSSQHAMFGNFYLFFNDHPGRVVTATHLDTAADMWIGMDDLKLADYVDAHLGELREPFFLIVQFGNTHNPRLHDPSDAPFAPWSTERSKPAAYRNFYRNSVYRSDKAVARVAGALRNHASGSRTVLVYTSDHGEGMREHDVCEHCCTMFEDVLRVPLWIDAPPGTLTDEERKNLEDKRRAYLFHTDVHATLLDLLRVWSPESAGARGPGRPLTRSELAKEPASIGNVSPMLEAKPSWGVMLGSRKLEAVRESKSYQCFDVEKNPGEKIPLPPAACQDLEERARAMYPGLPKDFPGLRFFDHWGQGRVGAPGGR